MITIDGLPDFPEFDGMLGLQARGTTAFWHCARFIARISLVSGEIEWLAERPSATIAPSNSHLPRNIQLGAFGANLWVDETGEVVAEIIRTDGGGVCVSARDGTSGAQLWEHFVSVPDAAEWAEAAPAWPGAQTEEITAFFGTDSTRLIVCLTRHTRRTRRYSRTVEVTTIPEFACQTDVVRLDPRTGKPLWSAEFRDVPVGIIERRSFTGLWSSGPRVGVIDFEAGTNTVLHELPSALGWPVWNGGEVAVSWHYRGRVGIDWIDDQGCRSRHGSWQVPRVRSTHLHSTGAGLALQTNDQSLWWLGEETEPGWSVRAKPYIYSVHRMPGTDVFIATDGRGGRLLVHDADSGRDTLNLKPVLGGFGDLQKIPGHNVLVSPFRVSRSYSVSPQLLVISMEDRRYSLEGECFLILGTWEHGVVCRVGPRGERLAIVDIRSTMRGE